MSERQSAFDIRAYLRLSPAEAAKAFSDDLSCLVMEASTSPDKRVTYWQTTSKKLVQGLDPEDPTTLTTYQIQELMNLAQDRYVIVWISPAGGENNYPLSRLNFYLGEEGQELHDVYSVAVDWALEKSYKLHNWLRFFSTNSSDGGELSPLCVDVPQEIGQLEYLQPYVDLPIETWDFIFSGEAKKKRESALLTAQTIAPAIIHWLNTHPSASLIEVWQWGAIAEQHMAAKGFSMRGRGTMCGLTNSELLGQSSVLRVFDIGKDTEEEISECVSIRCPNCNWTPSESQLQELNAGSLTCCPGCRYNPATRTIPPEYSEPTTTDISEFVTIVVAENLPTEPVLENDYSLPWSVYFFNPQLEIAQM